MSERILLVEDEEKLARMVEMELKYEGYEVEKALDGRRGLELALGGSFDLVLLDIMLPQLSGMEVLRRLRRESQVPVIMLTARDSVVDKVAGRLAAQSLPLAVGPLVMDVEKHQVTVRGRNVELTKKEFDLLRHLLENKDRVLTREALLDAVWGFDFVGETNSVDVYIRFLRSKLDDAFGLKLIHTVRGVGYVIKEE